MQAEALAIPAMGDDLRTTLFSTRAEAEKALENRAIERGFATTRLRPTKKDETVGDYLRRDFECVKGRKAPSKSTGKRGTGGRRTNCPWGAYIR